MSINYHFGTEGVVCKGKVLLSIQLAKVVCLHINMQEEDILEHTNVKCHMCTL